jgi:hypothetical protein
VKSIARVLGIILYIVEGICALAILVGLLFRSLNLAGASQLLMIGLFLIASVYVLFAITPYYKRYVNTDPIFTEKFTRIFRRVLYLVLAVLVTCDLFFANNLPGKEQMAIITIPLAVTFIIAAGILIALKSSRKLILTGVLIRMAIFLALYFVVSLSKATTPVDY